MSYEDFVAARQLLAEEAIGTHLRAAQRKRDEQWQASVNNLRRVK